MTNLLQFAILNQITPWSYKPKRVITSAGWYKASRVRWRAKDLVALIWQEFSISLSQDVVWKELRRLGFRYLSARPRHHAQDPQAHTSH